MSRPLVLFHKACVDGWCSAWIMDRCLGGCELVAAHYGDPPPNVDGRTVFVLDFSYSREVMIEMERVSHRLLVLDHHENAMEACADLPFVIFDGEKSGATITYWWCHDQGYIQGLKDKPQTRDIASGMSPLSMYVQDRDLWRFTMDSSESINAAIRSYKFDLDEWDYLARRMCVTPLALVTEGEAIQRYRAQIASQAVAHAHEVVIDDIGVPAALVSVGDIISDVGGKLAEGQPFAATYCPTSDGRLLVSLRSDERGRDVSEIARKYGGNGHARSAGFRLPYQYITELSKDHGVITASRQP